MARREDFNDWHTNIMSGEIIAKRDENSGTVEVTISVSFHEDVIPKGSSPDILVYATQSIIEPIGSRTSDKSPTFFSRIRDRFKDNG